jgi:GNAT superfamily N-acetyltransferase
MNRAFATRVPDLLLRPAVPADVPVILRFIRELAEYEKLTHQVVADEAALTATLFGDRPYAEVVLAELSGEPVGFALFFHNYSTFLGLPGLYLEDVYVPPDFRGRGVGGSLLTCLARIAVERGCGRMEWSVLDWNQPAIDFYRSLGAAPMDEWTVYRLTGDALAKLEHRTDSASGRGS